MIDWISPKKSLSRATIHRTPTTEIILGEVMKYLSISLIIYLETITVKDIQYQETMGPLVRKSQETTGSLNLLI